jgi:serine/threonine protein kinase
MDVSEIEVLDSSELCSPFILPAEGEILDGKYRITRRIGEGGMGVVYEGFHLHIHKRVALKFLTPAAMECRELIARFEREARASGQLSGPHAVQILDVSRMDSGLPFIVMELLVGRDLDREMRIRCGEPFTVSDAVDLVLETCDAMAEAHAAGIIHRDLKPANLFLASQEDGSRIVKVLDFGISKILREPQPDVTETCTAIGTPLYMSPEQIRSARHVDGRADIWSMGIILYELLTGDPPFMGTGTNVLAGVVADPTPHVRAKRRDVPHALEAVIERALAKSADERFPDVHHFAAALLPFASAPVRKRRSATRSDRATFSGAYVASRTGRMTRALGFAALIVPLLVATAFGQRRTTPPRDGVTERTRPALAQTTMEIDELPSALPTVEFPPAPPMPERTAVRRPPNRPHGAPPKKNPLLAAEHK